jgi:hypothetical protein
MYTIEIDFDVFKEITLRRKSEATSPNDVIRELLKLKPQKRKVPSDNLSERPWATKGVSFPPGTKFRATHKGQVYYAIVENGALVHNNKKFSSPSAAAVAITENTVNGWIFWECKMPGEERWQIIKNLR